MKDYIPSFLRRKDVVIVLGEDYALTQKQRTRLEKFFTDHGSVKANEGWLRTISLMLKFNLTNISGRIRRLKKMHASPNLLAFYLRYGRYYEKFYAETKKKRTSHLENRTAYWIEQGLSHYEAEKKVAVIQRERNEKACRVTTGTSAHTVRSVEYWILRGLSLNEAKEQVRLVQGRSHSAERNERWQKSLSSKAQHERDLINLKKSHSIQGYMARGMTFEEAHIAKEQHTIELLRRLENTKQYSNVSQQLFDMIRDSIGGEHIQYATNGGERTVKHRKVDFYDPISKIVIEFQGDYWHANPDVVKENFVRHDGKTAEEIRSKDTWRAELIASSREVSNLILVWERDFRRNPRNTAESLIKIIKEGRNRHGNSGNNSR